jgi:iron complex transport system substrate-binding protein
LLLLALAPSPPAAATSDRADATLAADAAEPARRAGRVISLDYCADQYALKLLDRTQILALSPEATAEYAYLRAVAADIPQVRPRAEEVLALAPDLILRSYGGGPNARAFFERAGVRVVSVQPGNTIASVFDALTATAIALGVADRGRATVNELKARLLAIEPPTRLKNVLYLTPAGFTSGPGALVHELIVAAGLRNFEEAPGWRPVSLERLAYEQPDIIAAAFFEGTLGERTDAWNPLRHPLLRRQLEAVPRVVLPSAWTACGGWFLIDAVERLSAAAHD